MYFDHETHEDPMRHDNNHFYNALYMCHCWTYSYLFQ